jgi:hypothetical protein
VIGKRPPGRFLRSWPSAPSVLDHAFQSAGSASVG